MRIFGVMKFTNRFILSFLILFISLQPAVYADCCGGEDERMSCCVLKDRHTHKNETQTGIEKTSCHEKKAQANSNEQSFTCCTHLPFTNLNFTPAENQRSNKPQVENIPYIIHPNNLLSGISFDCKPYQREKYSSLRGDKQPIWLTLGNFRC